MNAPKGTKMAYKNQKKNQKINKKQPQQQQQQQRLGKDQNENVTSSNRISEVKNSNQYNDSNNRNSLISEPSNNNSSTPATAVNISQKLRDYYHQQQRQQQQQHSKAMPAVTVNSIKIERSTSFSLRGKLAKLINSITSSKENLNNNNNSDENAALPTQFTRSRSLILPRRTNRRSLIEPQLEQLSEEAEKSIDPMSPSITRKNSTETDKNETTSDALTTKNTSASDPIEIPTSYTQRKTSTPLTQRQISATYDPQEQFKKRRSSSFIASFKNTFSGLGAEKKKEKLNPKWSASLQSLQAIDNMVSYENMSFIDYDKFNGYERQLERELSQLSLMDRVLNPSPQIIDSPSLLTHNLTNVLPSPATPINSTVTSPFITPQTVIRRRKRSPSQQRSARKLTQCRSVSRNSFNLDTDYEHNLDKPRNVYRDSLDSRKLELLNAISRSSFILDSDVVDTLDLADNTHRIHKHARGSSTKCCRRHSEHKEKRNAVGVDIVDATTNIQLKSKSLTHLDGLQTEVIYNNTKSTNNIIANVTTTHNTITTATLETNSLIYSSLSPLPPPPSFLQYQIKQSSLLLGRATSTSHHRHHFKNTKRASYSPQKFSNRLTPTIFTPSTTTTKSLSSILGAYSTITKSNTNITAAVSCCNRMYSARLGHTYPYCGCSALQPRSHNYCKNTFQSDASTTTSYDLGIASAQGSSGNVYEALCVASAKTAIYLPPPSDGRVIPTSYKNKNSFLQRSKAMLARSEVPNTEYFSVSFCTESTYQEDEFFPATKDVTLGIALSQALRRRNLSLSKLTITDTTNRTTNFLETESSFLNSSLDENTAVEHLAGHHLIITDKEGSRQTLHKANSFGSHARPPGLFSGDSTDESSDPNLTGKQLKQRWSGLFGVKNPQQTQLCELLNNYSKNGVPQRTTALHNFEHPQLDSAIIYLDNMHKSWRDIVECSQMSDGEIRIQTAIWELVTTEVDYIHCLQTVTDLFLACLESIQMEGLLQDVDQHRLFANIRDICEANLKFWTFHLYPMVSHSIITREPLHIGFFQTGFIQFAQMFAPYKKYCAEQSSCQFYCKDLNRTNSLFTSYLAWCESQKMCNRLRLADILVRPMQRLTKYSLLLAAIKKHLTDIEEIEAVDIMLHATENFVFSVNNHLTTRQESERLKGVMARIESYDVVDTNNEQLDKIIKQYSQMFDLCGPMKGCAPHHVRHLFMEGDHKIKDIHGKADVHCFLLTDILLVCKSVAKKGLGTLKVIRQPYLTDRLIVHHSHNVLSCVYLNEFQVVTTAFTLHCSEAKNWYEALKRAKIIYTRLKQCLGTNGDNNIRYTGGGSIISGGTIDSLSVKKSPVNSSVCSHVTSANNSHSGSVEWNDSRNISADFEKTNSLSSDEGGSYLGVHGCPIKVKPITTISPQQFKIIPTLTSKTLTVQPLNHLVQSLPNLTLHNSQTNMLMVPSCGTNHSGTALLYASHRGISYPPPSPTRVPLRRAMAFSSSIKNPPLLKTRNITSQNSINWHQIPATPTPTTNPQYTLLNQPVNISTTSNSIASNTTANVTTTQMNSLSCNTDVTLRDMGGKLSLGNNQNLSSRLSTNSETDI